MKSGVQHNTQNEATSFTNSVWMQWRAECNSTVIPSLREAVRAGLNAMKSGVQLPLSSTYLSICSSLNAMKSGVQQTTTQTPSLLKSKVWMQWRAECNWFAFLAPSIDFTVFECNEERSATSPQLFLPQSLPCVWMQWRAECNSILGFSLSFLSSCLNAMKSGVQP